MNLIDQIFFAVLIGSATSVLLLLSSGLLRNLFFDFFNPSHNGRNKVSSGVSGK